MTGDDSGRINAADEEILKGMLVEEFFMKLLVFQERLEKKIELIKSQTKQ